MAGFADVHVTEVDMVTRRSKHADTALATPTDGEYLGDHASLDAFVYATLEPLLPVGLHWLLGCLDLPAVLRVMSADGRDRLHLVNGRVYLERRPG